MPMIISWMALVNAGREIFLTYMRSFFGHGRHYWLWDFASTKTALERSGFQKIRRCKYGDNPDPMFGRVENKDRFVWAVSVECVK